MSRLSLSRDDQWIELRDPDLVTERLRRPITTRMALLERHGFTRALLHAKQSEKALAKDDNEQTRQAARAAEESLAEVLTPESLELLNEINDYSAVAIISAWSFDAPVTLDGLLDSVPRWAYDEIRQAVAKPAMALMPDFSASIEPDSPTEPSEQ